MAITLPTVTVPSATLDFSAERLIQGDTAAVVPKLNGYMTELEAWDDDNAQTYVDLEAFRVAVVAAMNDLDTATSPLGANSIGPAGPGNTGTITYELIEDRLYFAVAIDGNESLEKLLSDTTADENWLLLSSGEVLDWHAAISHLYPPRQEVKIWNSATSLWKKFTLAATSTKAQRLINPTSYLNTVYTAQ